MIIPSMVMVESCQEQIFENTLGGGVTVVNSKIQVIEQRA